MKYSDIVKKINIGDTIRSKLTGELLKVKGFYFCDNFKDELKTFVSKPLSMITAAISERKDRGENIRYGIVFEDGHKQYLHANHIAIPE